MRLPAALFLAIALVGASACRDGTGLNIDPLIATDTIELAAPSAGLELPSALDVTAVGGVIVGGRHPELQEHAEQWDLAMRLREGQLMFVPAAALGLRSRAAITRPITGGTFEGVIEAPGRGAFVSDSAVAVQTGAVYVVRSRDIACGFGGGVQYAKIQPLEVEGGRLRLQIATNERCQDPRLVPED